MTLLFKALIPLAGTVGAAAWVGGAVMVLAFGALRGLEETYGRDMDFLEPA